MLIDTWNLEKVVMKTTTVIGVTMVVLLAGNLAQADICRIVNGGFEIDKRPIDPIEPGEPNGWDVDVPAGKFSGYVKTEWVTDGGMFNLTLYSQDYATFEAGDIATVFQQMYLTDVNEITFDLKLETYYGTPWDPNKCTAVLLIDEDVVWESNSVGSDVRDDYYDQTYAVEDKYRDESLHKFSLGLRVNVGETLTDYYKTQWDSVTCSVYCEGGGLLAGDFNRDCYVDINDLKLVSDVWLGEVEPDDRRNLFKGDDFEGVINFIDFAVFANNWDGNMAELGEFAEKWLDVEPNGIINFFDYAIFADNWLDSSLPE